MLLTRARTCTCQRLLPCRSIKGVFLNRMASSVSAKASLSHEERTATEPRDPGLHPVTVDSVSQVNDQIKTYRLAIRDRQHGIKFQAGQWLDVHVPGIDEAGGFTITSTPRDALGRVSAEVANEPSPFLELAVQQNPDNTPAAWLWQPKEDILGRELNVRVGGSFIWPPSGVTIDNSTRAVFIAGGVGINPLISMLSHIRQQRLPLANIRFLYSTKLPTNRLDPQKVLFLQRVMDAFSGAHGSDKDCLELYLTGTWDGSSLSSEVRSINDGLSQPSMVAYEGRIDKSALSRAAGMAEERASTVFYICGPPIMTDSIVDYLRQQEHVEPGHVLCEKWW